MQFEFLQFYSFTVFEKQNAHTKEDLRFHPDSLLAEMAKRLPDVDFGELERMMREMAKNGEIKPNGGRRYRRYSLP